MSTLKIELVAIPGRSAEIDLKEAHGSLTDYQDSVQTNYSKTQVFGRQDPIVSYQHSSRNISFGVKFVNAEKVKQRAVQNFVAQCMALQYPTYKNDSNVLSISRPPLVRVSLGGLLVNRLCAMKGFAFTPQTGFTPQNSPEVRFAVGNEGGEDRVTVFVGASGSIGRTTFKTVTTKFDLIVLHESSMGFQDEGGQMFFGGSTAFDFGEIDWTPTIPPIQVSEGTQIQESELEAMFGSLDQDDNKP